MKSELQLRSSKWTIKIFKILKTTTKNITVREAKRDAELLRLNQEMFNDIEAIQMKIKKEEEETLTQVQYERSNMDIAIREYEMHTKAIVAKVNGQEEVEIGTTEVEIARVTAKLNYLQAQRDLNETIIRVDAEIDAASLVETLAEGSIEHSVSDNLPSW